MGENLSLADTPKKKALRGKTAGGRTWLPTLSDEEAERLRQRFSRKGPLWDQWEYRVRAGKILIYTPVIPWNPKTGKPDPALRYMAPHLRIVPSQPGPFGLQYWRHTERWEWLPITGTLEEIADAIEADTFGLCAPTPP